MADHDRHAERDADHRHASGHSGRGVQRDAAVHLLVLDVDPTTLEADLGALVGRAVEGIGEGAGDVGRDGSGVLGMHRRSAMLDQVSEDRVDRFGAIGPDPDPGIARVGSADSDLALVDLEAASHLENAVEDLGQQERIDDVSADLDLVNDAWYRR